MTTAEARAQRMAEPPQSDPHPPTLEVVDLVKHFPVRRGALLKRVVGQVRAVDGVSFTIARGETLALVGESGCGKSTTARAVLRLMQPTSGTVRLNGVDLGTIDPRQLRRSRAQMQIVFQDPYASLNPRMTVGQILAEKHQLLGDGTGVSPGTVGDLLERVGLSADVASRYPHEFSGGQRQRVGIARAIALNPSFVALDEPVSALDVSIQAQIINLLEDLQDDLGLTYLLIAHDLSVVRHISDRIAVMYLGKIVETAGRDDLFDNPRHPYTKALISAVPVPDPDVETTRESIILRGDVPNPADPPSGCRFRTRCWLLPQLSDAERRRCIDEVPDLEPAAGAETHEVACHHAGALTS
ncbi:ABC transporter ATP-binding protein [Intrasporangium sp.]|uniref:ABC transporter ATP-binding protein n=1 Tax=Intrasporangium sp. TaxID=1925024 RepID=UPI0039777CCF